MFNQGKNGFSADFLPLFGRSFRARRIRHGPDTGQASVLRGLSRPGLVVLVALLGGLHGCGTVPRSDSPAQVEDRAAPRPAAEGRVPEVAAYTPPATPVIARAEPQRAVAVLMRRAEDQRSAGDLDSAAVSLERALRIDPDDAELWHRLAAVRLSQQRHALVLELAAKSNALAAPQDRALRAANWELIARARSALGDAQGARAAQREAAATR